MTDRLIRKAELKRMLGVTSSTTIDKWERTLPGFPRRRRITGGVCGWLETEIIEWLRSRPVDGGRVPVEAIKAHRSTCPNPSG